MYDRDFYDSQSEGSLRSAKEVLPFIMELLHPRTVIDVGCGVGAWLSVYKDLGVERIVGLDGDYVPRDTLLIDSTEFFAHDLTTAIEIDEKFDLVQTVEVAEHLDAECADQFVRSLTKLGDVVVFAAAVPYQLGTGHINEQYIDYWALLFKEYNYYPVDWIRPRIWDNDNVESWYKQNLILFAKESYIESHPSIRQARDQTRFKQLSVIHPDLYHLRISMLVKVLVKVGHQLRAARSLVAAKETFELALHHDPELSEAWDALGQMRAENGHYQDGLHFIEKAILLKPAAAYYVHAAQLCIALGNKDKARGYANKVLSSQPEYEFAKSLLNKINGM